MAKGKNSKDVYHVMVHVTVPGGTEGMDKVKKKDVREFIQGQFPLEPKMLIGGGYKTVKVRIDKDVDED